MGKSRTILIALIAAMLGFAAGLFSQFGGAQDVTESAKYQELEGLFYETNQRFLQVQKENENLRGQIGVLEQMVETLNAEIEEINAVMDRPPSS
ncbi:MAG: hypothetical protein RJP95_02705 [Pirellulales bacterium]